MSEKKEFLKLAEELFEIAYEEGKEDGKDEAFASLSGLSLDDLSDILHGSGGKAIRGVKKAGGAKRGRKASAGGGKRIRRTAEDIAALAGKIHTVVKNGGKDGVSAETIREKLGIERKELPRAIAEALGQRLISKRGQKRATLYFAGSKTAKAGKPKGGAKKTKTHAKKSGQKKSKRPVKAKAVHTNGVTAAVASAPASAE